MARLAALVVSLFLLAVPALAQPTGGKPDILEIINAVGVVDDGMANAIQVQVEQINDNPRVKAVLLVVDSPGGSVLASAAIYEELSKLKVPVVGWCNNICASGGMYILMAPSVKYVGVRTQTISGSIGVIMNSVRYHRLLNWAMIDAETYKSGSRKDEGNPMRPVEEQEKKNLQAMIDGLAGSFYGIVAKSRGEKITNWPDVKTARVFFGADGVKVGLVDAVLTKEGAAAKAKELSGSKPGTIFTRDEMKKMSKSASDSPFGNEAPHVAPAWEALIGDAQFLVQTLREIKSGQTTRFEYRMHYAF